MEFFQPEQKSKSTGPRQFHNPVQSRAQRAVGEDSSFLHPHLLNSTESHVHCALDLQHIDELEEREWEEGHHTCAIKLKVNDVKVQCC